MVTLGGGDITLDDDAPTDRGAPAWRGSAGRFELLELLGKGGMGAVYKARDVRLDRLVALKLFAGVDPSMAVRFVREARAQARIEHPNICRVLEAGELDGRAYIALQLVDGEPLHRAAARMSLDDKVAALRDVALAIHEAHRAGIVHRDLKPSNIMIEQRRDGRWTPIVTDFGLARELTMAPGITRSGALLGTPAYMAPEQARGDVRAVDRRSDVYSLGATLYELLTGRPPFAAGALADTLAQVVRDEPAALRSVAPSVPIALETIALKCLAKDPAQRYPSARALADDLRRFLDGEPIWGRRAPLIRRLFLRARRHRGTVALAAGSLVIIAVLAVLGARALWAARSERARSERRAMLAERLGRDAVDLELFLQLAYQRPLHDTRSERTIVRDRMRAIAGIDHGLGAAGEAIVLEAIGRGHVALEDWSRAADQLGKAITTGRDTLAVHAALGRALGEQYHAALEEARRSGDPGWLAGRQRELAEQYLTPALAALVSATWAGARDERDGDSARLLAAWLALYRGDLGAAEQRGNAIGERSPWLVDARKLAATAAYRAAMIVFDRGDYDAADPVLARAAALYAEASEVARSDAGLYRAAAQTQLMLGELAFRRGRDPRVALERSLDAIDRALRADPGDAAAFRMRAYALLRWYRTPALRGTGDPQTLLEQIAEAAGRAAELDPQSAEAWDALGNAHVYRANYEAGNGGDDAPWWTRAVDNFARALAIRPSDPWANNDAGIAQRWLAERAQDAGRDPMPGYEAALRSYQRATQIDPQYVYAWSNRADLHTAIAEYQLSGGRDPRAAVEQAERAGERCLAIDRNFYSVLNTLAQAQLALAAYVVSAGGDPAEPLARAAGYLDRAAAVQPDLMVTWYYRLSHARIAAAHAVREGRDPSERIAIAQTALGHARRLAPRSAMAYVEAAQVALVEAAWYTRRPASAGRARASLLRARRDAQEALALDARSALGRRVAAEIEAQIAAQR